MKKVDVNTFVLNLKDELDSFATFELDYSSQSRTMGEWVDKFVDFAGYGDDEDTTLDWDEKMSEEDSYDDDSYYGQDCQYEELVNRRKYRSFRDDDRY